LEKLYNKMPRPFICRRVWFKPGITYFKPVGVPISGLDEVVLTVDEIEAVRLKDYEEMDQVKAAKKMNISQPTFHRLIVNARKKIADALVNGKAIRIEGGNYKMAEQAIQPGMGRGLGRGAGMGRGGGSGRGRMGGDFAAGPGGICKCPKCGYEEAKVRGIPCTSKKCPKCNSVMIRR